jgi:hypothetical protein
MPESVMLTMSHDKPSSMQWDGRDFRVLDEPTLLDMEYGSMTHPLPNPAWRFTAACADDVRVFDVRFDQAAEQWRMVRSYV